MDHAYVSGLPSASLDAEPSSRTFELQCTLWAGSAFATGAHLSVETRTVSASLSAWPSLTTSCATYVPGRSTTNDGEALAASSRAAALPAGTDASSQRYVRGLPSTSD